MGSSTEHSAFGPTANPWDLDRVPGRHSRVARRRPSRRYHAPLVDRHGHGRLDPPAGGAVRASSGMKPTYGRVSRYGIVAFASSLDQIGPFARDVARRRGAAPRGRRPRRARLDVARRSRCPDDLLRLPASDDEAASWLRGKRLGPADASTSSPGMEPGVEARIREAVAALEAAGATVEEVEPAAHGLRPRDVLHRRARPRRRPNLARYDGVRYGYSVRGGDDYLADYLATRGSGFGAEVKRRIMLGTYALSAGYYDAFYLKAQKVRTLIKRDFDAPVGRRASTRSSRRPRRPSRSGSAPGWPTRSRCTSRTRARCR